MIEDALRVNYTSFFEGDSVKLAASEYEPRICAIDLEHSVFKSNKLLNTYKGKIIKLSGEIKRTTDGKELHTSLLPKPAASFVTAYELINIDDKHCDTNGLLESDVNVCDMKDSVFRKASELLITEDHTNSKPCTITSGDVATDQSTLPTFPSERSTINGDHAVEYKPSTVLVKREIPVIKYFFEQAEENNSDECAKAEPAISVNSSKESLPDSNEHPINYNKEISGVKRHLPQVHYTRTPESVRPKIR